MHSIVLISGLAIFVASAVGMMAIYAWAAWDFPSTKHVRYVSPRYLLAGGLGAVVGLLLVVASR
jgi:hypothetical protein